MAPREGARRAISNGALAVSKLKPDGAQQAKECLQRHSKLVLCDDHWRSLTMLPLLHRRCHHSKSAWALRRDVLQQVCAHQVAHSTIRHIQLTVCRARLVGAAVGGQAPDAESGVDGTEASPAAGPGAPELVAEQSAAARSSLGSPRSASLLTARPRQAVTLGQCGLTVSPRAVRASMQLLHPFRPGTCPAGPIGREVSGWQTPVAQWRVCMC